MLYELILANLAHSRFRGSVNCGDPSMENRFQVRKASSIFVWSKMAQGSLGLPVWASDTILSGPQGVKGSF